MLGSCIKPLACQGSKISTRLLSARKLLSWVPRPARMSDTISASAKDASVAATPEDVPSGMEAEALVLEAIAEVPNITRVVARQQKGSQNTLVTVHMSQKNLAANNQRKFAIHAVVAQDGTVTPFSLPLELPDAQIISTSPNGQQQLVIKAGTDSASVVHQLWNGSRLVFEIQVPKALHGAVYTDGYFASGAVWSPDGGAVAYVADLPAAERTPSWGEGPNPVKDAAGPKGWRGVGAAIDDWGELNTGKRAPGCYLLDTRQRTVIKVSGVPADVSCGQPVWTRDSAGLVFVGWRDRDSRLPAMHRRLGVVYCYNRPCHLYHAAITRDAAGTLVCGGTLTPLTPTLDSAHSPLFSPNGTCLVFTSLHASAARNGTHNASSQMYKLPWPQALAGGLPPQVVVDLVHDPAKATRPVKGRRPFPGLYPSGILTEDAFIDNSTLLLTSTWYSQTAVLAVNIDSGEVVPITPVDSTPLACYTFMAAAGGHAFAVQVAPDTPPRLMVSQLPHGLPLEANERPQQMSWATAGPYGHELPSAASQVVSGLEYRVLQVSPTTGDPDQRHVFEVIVLCPRKRQGALPTVLAPHGGPHTSFTTGWYPPYAYLAHLGYTVVLPNYRGSTGYGEALLLSLPGHIGHHDVADCMDSLQAAADAGLADLSRVVVCGGSHGGFLAGHLAGQHPDAFKATIMRNPAGRARVSSVAQPEDLLAMFAASPVAHVKSVKAPMLLLLGAKDRRVPLTDGLQYAAAVQGQGVPVRVLTFPEDTHGLDKPQTDFEQWINVAWWLKKYC